MTNSEFLRLQLEASAKLVDLCRMVQTELNATRAEIEQALERLRPRRPS